MFRMVAVRAFTGQGRDNGSAAGEQGGRIPASPWSPAGLRGPLVPPRQASGVFCRCFDGQWHAKKL